MTAGGVTPVELKLLTGDAGLVAAVVMPGGPEIGRVPFELTLRNLDHGAVTVTNPYEGASYHLITIGGQPVEVAGPPSQAKVHVALDPAAKLAYLDLAAATVDGKAIERDEFIRSDSLELPKESEIVLSLAVPASLDPSDLTRIDHVPAGEYQLVVMLRVVVTVNGKRHPVLLRTSHDLSVAAA